MREGTDLSLPVRRWRALIHSEGEPLPAQKLLKASSALEHSGALSHISAPQYLSKQLRLESLLQGPRVVARALVVTDLLGLLGREAGQKRGQRVCGKFSNQ